MPRVPQRISYPPAFRRQPLKPRRI